MVNHIPGGQLARRADKMPKTKKQQHNTAHLLLVRAYVEVIVTTILLLHVLALYYI